ncbi:MFS transporter [Solwaraspora sp. WMMB335]|uniref:MFS transporter n=1 Tax=Solwaraspora sp. WMMB335 TaxID=3404118 RepID=UPI003B963E79
MTGAPVLRQAGDADRATEGKSRLGGHYWRLWWANTINSVGDGAFVAALPLLAVSVTTDPRDISAIATATYLPWLLLSLPVGVIVDRYDRATLMWRCQAFQGVVVAGVALAAATGHTSIPLLLAASFLLGSAQVVITNAAQSVLPQLVPAPLLQRANANQYVVQTLGQSMLGPPLGSLLFVVAAALPFGLDAASFALSAFLLFTLPRIEKGSRRESSMRAEMTEGLLWLKRHRLLRTLAFMLGMNTFCHQMGFATLVLFATQTLHLSYRDYGLMLVGVGVGSIIGGFVNSRIARWLGPLPALLLSYAANAVIYIAMGLAPNGGALTILLGACGLVVTVTSIVTVSLRQQMVPDRLLGRVNSVYRMIGWGLMPVGSLLGGLIAQHFGLRAPFLGAGAIRIVVLLLAAPIVIGSIRKMGTSSSSPTG